MYGVTGTICKTVYKKIVFHFRVMCYNEKVYVSDIHRSA